MITSGLRRLWINPWGSCHFPFFTCPYKLGCAVVLMQSNATANNVILHQQLPWKIYFLFLCWNLWLAKNEQIFKNQSQSQHSLVYTTMQAATEYFFLASFDRPVQVRTSQIIRWSTPNEPYIKLNTDGSSISNPRMASAGGLLHDSSGLWISRFSLNMDVATNNMAELEAVRQGLLLAWELGFKFIQLEIDSVIVLS